MQERVWEVYRYDRHPCPLSSLHAHPHRPSLLSLLLSTACCLFLFLMILNPLTSITSLQHAALVINPLVLFFATHLHLHPLALLLELGGPGHSLFINVAHAIRHSVYYAFLCSYSKSTSIR